MKKVLLTAALVLCASSAYAAPDRFAQMDKDGNGQVDWNEFSAAIPNMKRPAFDMIDTDKSGGICRSEWDAFATSHGAGMMGGKKMPPAGMGMPPAGMGKAMPPAGGDKGAMPLIQPPAQQNAAPAAMPPKN